MTTCMIALPVERVAFDTAVLALSAATGRIWKADRVDDYSSGRNHYSDVLPRVGAGAGSIISVESVSKGEIEWFIPKAEVDLAAESIDAEGGWDEVIETELNRQAVFADYPAGMRTVITFTSDDSGVNAAWDQTYLLWLVARELGPQEGWCRSTDGGDGVRWVKFDQIYRLMGNLMRPTHRAYGAPFFDAQARWQDWIRTL